MWAPVHGTDGSGRFSVLEYPHQVMRVFGSPFHVTDALRNGGGC